MVPSSSPPIFSENPNKVDFPARRVPARPTGRGELAILTPPLVPTGAEALAGAGPIFGGSEVIFMEVSWIRIGNVPLLNEVLGQMAEKNYVPYDVMNLNYRPRDRALWQSDFVFVKKSSSLLASRDWA